MSRMFPNTFWELFCTKPEATFSANRLKRLQWTLKSWIYSKPTRITSNYAFNALISRMAGFVLYEQTGGFPANIYLSKSAIKLLKKV